jgi:protein-disulfide isomerase
MKKHNILTFLLLLVFNINVKAEDFSSSVFKPNSYDLYYGQEDAPIQVLEYFTLTCPHCSHFYLSSFPTIKKEYIDKGKVRWIKRSYVADAPSLKGTMLLSCVEKDRYESYLRILLGKQSNWAYQDNFIKVLANIARLGGMSQESFDQCMANKELEQKILDISKKSKEQLKISGTPSFYINQKHLQFFSLKSFKDHFDLLLSK